MKAFSIIGLLLAVMNLLCAALNAAVVMDAWPNLGAAWFNVLLVPVCILIGIWIGAQAIDDLRRHK